MSIVFSKKKDKRSRSTSSEANNSSFVKNVTSRVSGLLPAAVTKWFSSPSSTANGSAQTADATDSSTDEEGPESPINVQPPSKRMRYTSPGSYNQYGATDIIRTTGNVEGHDIDSSSPYGTGQSPSRTTFRRETNFVATPLRSEDTTGPTERDVIQFKPQHSISSTGPSVATKRKSLFDSPTNDEMSKRACAKTACNTITDPNKPRFKPSLLGSPFYPGRTMYGGASSSYINQPNIKLRKRAVVNEASTSDNTVSHSTQRIMDLLENYSSPLIEARRIPQITRSPRNSSFSSSYSSSSPPSNKVMSYKTQELHVPSIASILRLKQRSRLMDTTTVARQLIASHSSTTHFAPYPSSTQKPRESTEKEPSTKTTTKVKSKISKPNAASFWDTEAPPTPVNLPSAVLQIDKNNLPKFTITSLAREEQVAPMITSTPKPPSTHTETFKTVITMATKIPETPLRKPDIVTSATPYTFSSPVRISSDPPIQSSTNLPKFTFDSPDRSIDRITDKKDYNIPCVVGATKEPENKTSTTTVSKDWKCGDCWVFNKPDADNCVCCGGEKPSQNSKTPAKCVICKLADSRPLTDKCVNCEKLMVNSTGSLAAVTKKQDDSSKWKCEDCWVINDMSVESCVCCGSSKPKKSIAVKQNAVANDKDSEWKCEDCWIKNKSTVDKCAACGAAKSGAQQSCAPTGGGFFNSPLPKPPDNTFKKIIKTQTDKWECPSCLVRNDGDKTRCICCETERAGVTKESDKKSFNFGMNTNTTFKFGIPPKSQETTAPKLTDVKTTTESKKEESETNNNVLSKTPTFSFGLPAKQSEDKVMNKASSVEKVEEKTDKADAAPKVNFTFGVPKTSSPIVVAPVFGIPTKATEAANKTSEKDEEKPQEVPKVDFTIPKSTEPPKLLPNVFALPMTSIASPEKAAGITSGVIEKPVVSKSVIPMSNTEKSELSSKPLMLQPASSSSDSPAQVVPAAFSFGSGGGIKISSNLFATQPTTATATSISFGNSLQSASSNTPSLFQNNEPTTSSSAMSLFPKSDPPSTVSLFAKSDPPAGSSEPSTLGAPAPMFNFGGGSQTQQPEKPKFNFSFGSSSKPETQTLFKAPDNKFSFGSAGTGATIGSTNVLGGNGLSTGSALGGNNGPLGGASDMASNPLTGGNGLPASTVQAPSGGIFGATVQKENMWPAANNKVTSNPFVSNTPTNPLQKPAAFTFGATPPFNSNTSSGFGSPQAAPMFGMGNQNSNSQPMFSNTMGSQPATNMFGSTQGTGAPSMGMFGTPAVGAAPTFGSPNPSLPPFEANSMSPAPAPSFNFGSGGGGGGGGGSAQHTAGVFGFCQPQQQAPQTGHVYNFGAAPQFTMGNAPANTATTAVRRVRKAVRRNPPR